MSWKDTTIIICCAGMGTRLGIGTTKALINVAGKSLIRRQIEALGDFDDIRVVVGYQAEGLIKAVNEYRKDIMFAFNYDYQNTGPLESVNKAILGAKKYTVVMGGDMLIHPEDMDSFLSYPGECIGFSRIHSAEPIFLSVNNTGEAVSFEPEVDQLEWSGLVKFESQFFKNDKYYVHQMVKSILPIKAIETRGIDVDTPEDYEKVVEWVLSGYSNDLLS